MPADDLTLALRIRADVQQALDALRAVNASLGDTHGRGRQAGHSLRSLGQAALRAGDEHEALGLRAQDTFAAMIEGARTAARDQREFGESWIDSMRAGLERFRRDSEGAARETRDATIGAFRSMEDAVADFVATGRLSISGFVDSVIADLARLTVRRTITQPLADLLSAALSSVTGAGAAGGEATLPDGAARGSRGNVRGSTLPPALFDVAPRFHAGGIAGLRPDEVPVTVQRGEGIFTPAQMRALGSPNVTVRLENRGTPQREVSREVHFDPRGPIVTVVTDDLMYGGPIRQTIRRELRGGL